VKIEKDLAKLEKINFHFITLLVSDIPVHLPVDPSFFLQISLDILSGITIIIFKMLRLAEILR